MKLKTVVIPALAALLCGCGGRNALEKYRPDSGEDCARKVWEFSDRAYKTYIGSVDTEKYTGYYDKNKKDWIYYRHLDVVKSSVSKITLDGVEAYIVPINCEVKGDEYSRYIAEYYFMCSGPDVLTFKRIYKIR
ncbi:MAG: hypothetical protein LLG37_05675 [Spirochaetia bacterium]|nr:hypothetical protein [Spirochaetia bacterium]